MSRAAQRQFAWTAARRLHLDVRRPCKLVQRVYRLAHHVGAVYHREKPHLHWLMDRICVGLLAASPDREAYLIVLQVKKGACELSVNQIVP